MNHLKKKKILELPLVPKMLSTLILYLFFNIHFFSSTACAPTMAILVVGGRRWHVTVGLELHNTSEDRLQALSTDHVNLPRWHHHHGHHLPQSGANISKAN